MSFDKSKIKPKEVITVKQPVRYPNNAVITLLPVSEDSRHTIKFNKKAVELLGITEENCQIAIVNDYNVSTTDTPVYATVMGSTNEKTIDMGKSIKTYQCHTSTHCVKSKEIYSTLCEMFNFNNNNEYELELIPCGDEHIATISVLNSDIIPQDNNVNVEVSFNKGEDIEIEVQ